MLSKKDKERVSFTVVNAAFRREGEFTAKSLADEVENEVLDCFRSKEDLRQYIIKKMENVCEDGLIIATETYYVNYP